jgi:hypothetical protein
VGADPPSAHRDTVRLVAFSDGVFAITITLLVLEIRPPGNYNRLLHGLLALWPSYLAYVVTFLFIGQVWANHHVMFDHIRVADRLVLLLNTLLLMVVAFLPFATSVLAGAFRHGGWSADRCRLLRHRIRPDGSDVQRRVAVREPSSPAQPISRSYRGESDRQAFSARPRVAQRRGRARRRATRPRRCRDRCVQRLLLAPNPRRRFPTATLKRPEPKRLGEYAV